MINDTTGFALGAVLTRVYRYRGRPATCGPMVQLPADSALTLLPTLHWLPAEGCFDGYYLQIGYAAGGEGVLPRTDLGLDTFFQVSQPLPPDTQLYATVIPYNHAFGPAEGCASLPFTTITCPTLLSVVDTGFCEGSSLAWGDSLYTAPGQVELGYLTAQGCDSILILNITEYHNSTVFIDTGACPGENLLWGDSLLAMPGQYTFQYLSAQGCDSSVLVNFSYWPTYEQQADTFFCQGEPFYWGDSLLTEAGAYTFAYLSSQGCDSTVQVVLEARENIFFDTTILLQPGEPYQGEVYESDTLLQLHYPAGNGCDSLVSVQLSILSAGKEEPGTLKGWRCYPNPSSGTLWLEGPEPLRRITLYQLDGRRVAQFEKMEPLAAQPFRYRLTFGPWPSGLYLLRLEGEQAVWLERVALWEHGG